MWNLDLLWEMIIHFRANLGYTRQGYFSVYVETVYKDTKCFDFGSWIFPDSRIPVGCKNTFP